jgi:hypothetical protein
MHRHGRTGGATGRDCESLLIMSASESADIPRYGEVRAYTSFHSARCRDSDIRLPRNRACHDEGSLVR